MSRRVCCVVNCRETTRGGIKLFKLPEDAVRQKIWLERIEIKKSSTNNKLENIRVCSKHFKTGKCNYFLLL